MLRFAFACSEFKQLGGGSNTPAANSRSAQPQTGLAATQWRALGSWLCGDPQLAMWRNLLCVHAMSAVKVCMLTFVKVEAVSPSGGGDVVAELGRASRQSDGAAQRGSTAGQGTASALRMAQSQSHNRRSAAAHAHTRRRAGNALPAAAAASAPRRNAAYTKRATHMQQTQHTAQTQDGKKQR